jgi:DNA-binding transcriptional regulator YhcF (GntR family)
MGERRAWTDARLTEMLRERVLGGIHMGHLEAGVRLPSYREVADETGVADLRAVARAYAALEAEGLVEVRGRSGVFVAVQERIGGRVLAETARWAARVVREGWMRRVAVPALPGLLQTLTATRAVRCAFVESTVDQTETFCTELRRDFGFDAVPVHADRLVPVLEDGRDVRPLPEEVRGADLLATTAFHAAQLAPLAERLGIGLVVVRLNRSFTQAVRRQLDAGELVVLCVDPRFVERVRLVAGPPYAERIRGVLAMDRDAVARLDPGRAVLVSDAARHELPGVALPPSFTDEPMISAGSADDLAEALVRLNLEPRTPLPDADGVPG